MQIDANFINDLYDYLKGSDREDRLGPERACAQGWISPSGMKKLVWFSFLVSAVLFSSCATASLSKYHGIGRIKTADTRNENQTNFFMAILLEFSNENNTFPLPRQSLNRIS
jgi:predicted small secreted protein